MGAKLKKAPLNPRYHYVLQKAAASLTIAGLVIAEISSGFHFTAQILLASIFWPIRTFNKQIRSKLFID